MHGGGVFGSMLPGGDPFSNSEFELNREQRNGILSPWSRNCPSYFSGMEGAMSLNGDVLTTMLGTDYTRGSLTVGLSVGPTPSGWVAIAVGRRADDDVDDRLLPVAGLPPQRPRLGVGTDGHGTRAPSLTPDGANVVETGVSMAMSAVGTRGELVGPRATSGFGPAIEADAFRVCAVSEQAEGAQPG